MIILDNPDEVTISIPKDLAEKLRKRAESAEFNSLSTYITYILRQVASRIETDEKADSKTTTKEDEEKIKETLRSLGYLE